MLPAAAGLFAEDAVDFADDELVEDAVDEDEDELDEDPDEAAAVELAGCFPFLPPARESVR